MIIIMPLGVYSSFQFKNLSVEGGVSFTLLSYMYPVVYSCVLVNDTKGKAECQPMNEGDGSSAHD